MYILIVDMYGYIRQDLYEKKFTGGTKVYQDNLYLEYYRRFWFNNWIAFDTIEFDTKF